MSSPMSTTAGSCFSMMSMAELSAWIMFICATASGLLLAGRRGPPAFRAHQRPLFLEIPGHVLEYILEHEIRIEPRPFRHCPECGRLLPARGEQFLEFGRQRPMPLFRPLAELDQMLLEP